MSFPTHKLQSQQVYDLHRHAEDAYARARLEHENPMTREYDDDDVVTCSQCLDRVFFGDCTAYFSGDIHDTPEFTCVDCNEESRREVSE